MAASTAPPSDGIGIGRGRRAVSLAGVAAWLTTTARRKFSCTSMLSTLLSCSFGVCED
jgi:hypothetical protein